MLTGHHPQDPPMARPCSSCVLPNVLLKLLVDIPALLIKEESLVTEIVSCPAYSLYLSHASQRGEKIRFDPGFGPPINDRRPKIFENLAELIEIVQYTPLFTLKKIRRRGVLRRERILRVMTCEHFNQ